MWLILTFVVNSGLSFLLGLAVAAVLGPDEFGRFAVASVAAIVASTLLFEWLRLSTTRFLDARSRDDDPDLRASLDRGYVGAALVLAGLAVAGAAAGLDGGLGAATLVATACVAATTGGFEYAGATARALFLNGAYARLVLLKNVLAFAAMVAAGWYFGSAAWVLAAFALSTFLAVLSVGRAVRPRPRGGRAEARRLVAFARYGAPIVAANLAYQAMVLVNRVAATATLGYAAGGQLSLATDVTIRVFLSAGAALDVFLFQRAVRRGAEEGSAAAHRQVADNMVVVLGVLALGAVGFVCAMPAFVAVAVPERFRAEFGLLGTILTPGVVAFCLVQFALSPVFQLARRTAPIFWTALAALVADGVLLLAWPGEPSPARLAAIHATSLVVSLPIAGLWALRSRECRPPLRDIAGVLMAAGAAALAIWPTRMVHPAALSLGAAIVLGTGAYAAVLLVLDVGRCRRLLGRASRFAPPRLARGRA